MQEQKFSPIPFFKMYSKKDEPLNSLLLKNDFRSYGIIISLLKHIYSAYGYYTSLDSNEFLSFKKDSDLEEEELNHVLERCFEIDLFDKHLFSKHRVLTSVDIQRNWQEVAKLEKIYGYKINPEYLLLRDEEEILHLSLYDSISLAIAD